MLFFYSNGKRVLCENIHYTFCLIDLFSIIITIVNTNHLFVYQEMLGLMEILRSHEEELLTTLSENNCFQDITTIRRIVSLKQLFDEANSRFVRVDIFQLLLDYDNL